MFKAAFITDLHFGIKGNSDIFLANASNYLNNEFIPYLKEHDITYIFIGGDIFDNRQSVNIKTFNYVLSFFNRLNTGNYKVVVIAGNHDLYLSTSNELTSLSFLNNFPNVTFICSDMLKVTIDNTNIMFVPWIPSITDFVDKPKDFSDCNVCIGHFEFIGFKMNKTSKLMDDGIPDSVVSNNFNVIISGHYHMRNEKTLVNGSKVIYTGSPYQLTRADSGEDRGFCVLSFDNNKLIEYEFVNNKNCIKFESVVFPHPFDELQIKGNIIDIMVNYSEKFDEVKLDEYKNKIESFNPICKPEIRLINDDEIDIESEINGFATKTTVDLINDFVDEVSIEKKDEVRKEILDLYNTVRMEE